MGQRGTACPESVDDEEMRQEEDVRCCHEDTWEQKLIGPKNNNKYFACNVSRDWKPVENVPGCKRRYWE